MGIIQSLMLVEFFIVMVNDPGAKTPERRRRRVRAEKTTMIGLKKRA